MQPAEFAKITVLIAVASIAQMRMNGMIGGRRFVVIVLVATIVPLILIYRQPDLGTAIILAVGVIALALLAGISWKVVGLILGVVVAYIVVACITQPYHLDRIVSMLDPWVDPQGDGYQANQSLYAFGSGGVFGTGIGLSRQKYLYLPYAHTDFIYAIVARSSASSVRSSSSSSSVSSSSRECASAATRPTCSVVCWRARSPS